MGRTAPQGVLPAMAREPIVLDHGQDDGGGADLQEIGQLGKVGVAQDDVQPPVLLGVAVGSSRVFTIGRFRVVSRPTSSSKKSARWVI